MINVNDLHKSDNPRLLFMANSLTNKGRSNKSFTIQLVVDGYNDTMLDGVFTSRAARVVKFDAEYTVSGVTLRGKLVVTSAGKYRGEALFLTGNGTLWETIGNKNIRDYDYTAWSHVLTYNNVTASEGTREPYVYDLCDRGQFLQETTTSAKVDIIERYPAVSVKQLIELVCNQEGYGVVWSEVAGNLDNIADIYMLFTGDSDIRNDSGWLKDSLFDSKGDTLQYQENTIEGGNFVWTEDIELTEVFDNGGNYNTGTGVYTVRETGTYRFVFTIAAYTVLFEDNLGGQPKIAWASTNNRARLTFAILRNGTAIHRQQEIVTLVGNSYTEGPIDIDTKYIELSQGDKISARITVEGNVTYTAPAFQSRFAQDLTTVRFYNDVSRWYGAGSTVDFGFVLPDIAAIELLSKIFNALNLYAFTNEDSKQLSARQGRQLTAEAMTLTFDQPQQELNEITNTWLRFQTDKAAPPLDLYFDSGGTVDRDYQLPVSRTLIDACFRLFQETDSTVPLLWEASDKNPSVWAQRFDPPKWTTKAAMRLLRYNGTTACTGYTITFGGSLDTNEDTLTSYPSFSEIEYVNLFRYDLSQQDITVTGYSRLPMYDLYSQKLFSSPVWLTGYGAGWIEQAEQIRDDVFKVTIKLAGGGYNG